MVRIYSKANFLSTNVYRLHTQRYTCRCMCTCTHIQIRKYAHTLTWKATVSIQSASSGQIRMGKQSNRITWSLSSLHCRPLGRPVVSTRHWSWGGQRLEWDQHRWGEQQQRVRVIKWGKLCWWQPAPTSQWCTGSLYRGQGALSL